MNNTMNELRVLIVDDELELRKSIPPILKTALPNINFEFEEAEDGEKVIELIRQAPSKNEAPWDLVLMDVRMPGLSGLEVLSEIKATYPGIFVVIMTAHSNLEDAVTAIKNGAYDYVQKPLEPSKLTEILEKAIDAKNLVTHLTLSSPVHDDDIDTEFVGASKKMKEVFELIHRLSQVDTTVLIRGENGTGKELVARAIHYNSPRKDGPFIAINCGALPEQLMESELFGHEKGAFTGAVERKIGKFQAANKGTLFLDEIGELKPDLQVKLLRALQERKFTPVGSNREVKTSTHIVAATNQNLEKMMEDGSFREDLFYRLNVMPIFLPPLRERIDDLSALTHHFIRKYARQHSKPIQDISTEALAAMKKYRWPGNIRELENVIEHAFIIENTAEIQISSLPSELREAKSTVDMSFQNYSGPLDFDAFKEKVEKEFIVNALKANNGKINRTVADANIPKNTLLRKIKKYGINVKDFQQ